MSTSAHRSVELQAFGDLLISLLEILPSGMVDPVTGAGVAATGMYVDLPIEARLGRDAEMLASLPRGRLATGFQLPHGRLTAHFESAPGRSRAEEGP